MQRFTLRAPRRQTRQQIEFALLNLLVKVGMGAWPSGQEVAVALTELVEVLDSHNRYRFQANPEQLAV